MLLRIRVNRWRRALLKVAHGLANPHHPLLVHLIPMRRCNLACVYCNEYDDVSAPVPLEVMQRRIDALARLRTTTVTLSGGEPLMHPALDRLVARIRERGMFATLITNGYYLSRERIQSLNAAGLDHLQISIDNVEPDEVSLKSLRLLEPKLKWLAQYRTFSVSINSVIGSGIRRPQEALVVARRARELGFMTTVGIAHDGRGQLRPLSAEEMQIFRELRRLGGLRWTRINSAFQTNLAAGRPNDWSCRAGARYLYVDEDGLVHYCSQQRGTPAIPIEEYTFEDIRREYNTPKSCAPFCTINCVQQVAWFDRFRAPQRAPVRDLGLPAKDAEPVPAVEASFSPGTEGP